MKDKVIQPKRKFRSPCKYKITDVLGQGTFGGVFRVQNKTDKKQTYAWKEAFSLSFVEMQELFLVAMIDHPNIITTLNNVKTLDCLDTNNLGILMPLGYSMDKFMKLQLVMSEDEQLNMTHQLINGMYFLHSNGILHLDTKPHNIIYQGNYYQIADFGLSMISNKPFPVITIDRLCITATFMSPEFKPMVKNRPYYTYTSKQDIFALGLSIVEIITGGIAFDQETKFIVQRNTKYPYTRHSKQKNYWSHSPKISPEVKKILTDMLQFNPEQRLNSQELMTKYNIKVVKGTMLYPVPPKPADAALEINFWDFFDAKEQSTMTLYGLVRAMDLFYLVVPYIVTYSYNSHFSLFSTKFHPKQPAKVDPFDMVNHLCHWADMIENKKNADNYDIDIVDYFLLKVYDDLIYRPCIHSITQKSDDIVSMLLASTNSTIYERIRMKKGQGLGEDLNDQSLAKTFLKFNLSKIHQLPTKKNIKRSIKKPNTTNSSSPSNLTVVKLKAILKQHQVRGYSKMRKADLIKEVKKL